MLSELGPSVRAQSNSGVTDRQRGREKSGREKKGRAGLVCRITLGTCTGRKVREGMLAC